MKTNVGIVDRALRMLGAVVILVLFLTNIIAGKTAIVLLAVAFILFMTALLRFCPLYRIFRINTWNKK